MSSYLLVPMTEEVQQSPAQTRRFQLLVRVYHVVRVLAAIPFAGGLFLTPSGKWSAALSFAGYCNLFTYIVVLILCRGRYLDPKWSQFDPSTLYLVIEAIMTTLCLSAAAIGLLYGNEQKGCLNQPADSDVKPSSCLKVPISVYWSLTNGLFWAILFALDSILTYMYNKSQRDDIEALFVVGEYPEINEIGENTDPNQAPDATETENLIDGTTANQRD